MRRIVMTGAFTLALTLGACAAKQPPTPPPLNLVTEAEPKAEAPPAPANSGADPCSAAARGSAGDQRARQERRLGDLQNTGLHALSV